MSRARPPSTVQVRLNSRPSSMNAPIRSLPPESERLPIAAASSAASGRTAKTASSARSTGGSNTRPHISSAAVSRLTAMWASRPLARDHIVCPIRPKRVVSAAAPTSRTLPRVSAPRRSRSSTHSSIRPRGQAPAANSSVRVLCARSIACESSSSRRRSERAATSAASVPFAMPTWASHPVPSAISPIRASARASGEPAVRTAPRAANIAVPASRTSTWATCASIARSIGSKRTASRCRSTGRTVA